jgi:mRNA-degrading endonuclease toxin of MazEF toxin-antitoxin module
MIILTQKNYSRGDKQPVHPEAQEYYDIASWLKDKVFYHDISKRESVNRRQVNHGEIWYCDLGYNIGSEKNKSRPVLIISNNKINRSSKIVVLCITDAKGKLNKRNLPAQDSWFLIYSATTDDAKKIFPGRLIPPNTTAYSFLDKDSVIQCEEIRIVSKARLDRVKGCIGTLTAYDFSFVKQKFKGTYNL